MFTGFTEETLQFFLDIRFHNHIGYFEENRERFRQDVQAPFYAFIEDMTPAMLAIDPRMETRPYKCLARIRRDTRFSKDKSPFRDHLWVLFRRAGEPREGSVMYYFEFSPRGVMWGLGTWGENRPAMDILRRRIAAQPQYVQDVIDACRLPERHLALGGSFFKRLAVPEEVPPRLKPWYLAREIYIGREDARIQWAYDGKLVDRVLKDFRAMTPLYKLLRGAWDEAAEQEA